MPCVRPPTAHSARAARPQPQRQRWCSCSAQRGPRRCAQADTVGEGGEGVSGRVRARAGPRGMPRGEACGAACCVWCAGWLCRSEQRTAQVAAAADQCRAPPERKPCVAELRQALGPYHEGFGIIARWRRRRRRSMKQTWQAAWEHGAEAGERLRWSWGVEMRGDDRANAAQSCRCLSRDAADATTRRQSAANTKTNSN